MGRKFNSNESRSLGACFAAVIGYAIYQRLHPFVVAAPPELLCLIPAAALIALFQQHLSQKAKLIIACIAVLIGYMHRQALVANPESGIWFVTLAFRLYEPVPLAVTLVVCSLIHHVPRQIAHARLGGDKLQETFAGERRNQRLEQLRRRITSFVRSSPLIALGLLMVAVVTLVFVRFQSASEHRPSVADDGFRQIQSSVKGWQLLDSDLKFRIQARHSPYSSASHGMDILRMTRLREMLSERMAKYEDRFHQTRDRLDREALERTVSPQEVQFYDAMLCHESLIDQFSQTAEAVRMATPLTMLTIPFEDRYTTNTAVATYSYQPEVFDAEDQVRITGEYDRKTREAQARLELLKQGRFPSVGFDPLAALTTLHTQPLALSKQDRTLLSQHLLQRLRSQPWRLGVAWDLFSLKRLDGIRVLVPSLKVCTGIAFMLAVVGLFISNLWRLPKRIRHHVDHARQARRKVLRGTRSLFLSPHRNRHSR